MNQEPAASRNLTPFTGGDGGRFFATPLEGQICGAQPTNLVDRREYGGAMVGFSSNFGMDSLGSGRYFNNTSQVQQRLSAPSGGYLPGSSPLSNAGVLGGYPTPGYGYSSSDGVVNVNNMGLPVNIGVGGGPMGAPTYTFRTSGGMNVTDPAGVAEMGLSLESGMDAGWLTFMRDCGIMDVTEG